jgi:serine/threonine protein kinase
MRDLNHHRLINLIEVLETSSKIYLVIEYAGKGTVSSIIPLSEESANKYFVQLIDGIEYLHEVKGVAHRDIKPENLLLTDNDDLKISDFGCAHSILSGNGKDVVNNVAGTYAFMSPELYNTNGIFKAKKVDIWAAGVTLFYFLFGKIPFTGRTIAELALCV